MVSRLLKNKYTSSPYSLDTIQLLEQLEEWTWCMYVCCINLNYSTSGAPINLTCDACNTGGSGIVSRGSYLYTAAVVTFWSRKFNSAQQNYPIHEQELLAIVESLKWFQNLLHGAHFRIFPDHKSLEFVMTQQKLSPRQARWLETLSEFDFTFTHILGQTNVLADVHIQCQCCGDCVYSQQICPWCRSG